MAYQIIQHRVVKPVEYAVHFKCRCGCEFWADQNSFSRHIACELSSSFGELYYETKCPECTDVVYSTEAAVPKSDVFTE